MNKKLFRPLLSLMALFLFLVPSYAQLSSFGFSLSNNITGLPVLTYPKLFTSQFHPGIDLTYSRKLNRSDKNKFYLNANIGGYHHEFVQTLVRIYPDISFQRKISEKLDFKFGLGAGYGLSFEGDRAFIQNEDGTYSSKSLKSARSQYLITAKFGLEILISAESKQKLFFQFASVLQGTYVKSYVPILPVNSFHIGYLFPLKNTES